jgi:hypothetical protein
MLKITAPVVACSSHSELFVSRGDGLMFQYMSKAWFSTVKDRNLRGLRAIFNWVI